MQLIELHCAHHSRFRLGNGSLQETEDILHSDTLFNGWMNAYLRLYGADSMPEVIAAFQSGEARCSSAFHFVAIFKYSRRIAAIYFVPKPFLRRALATPSDEADASIKKRIKKLHSISLPLLRQLLQSIRIDQAGELRFTTDLLAHTAFAGEYALDKEEVPEELWPRLQNVKFRQRFDAPKVAVGRLTTSAEDLFYQSDCLMSWQKMGEYELRPGFYFLAQLPLDVQLGNRLTAALNLLADEGLGGERSSGAGFFTRIEVAPFQWPLTGDYAMLLSLTFPNTKGEFERIVNYQSILRGGYIGATGVRKNQLRMLREGSIIRLPFAGAAIKDSPNDAPQSFRCGRAFYLQFPEADK